MAARAREPPRKIFQIFFRANAHFEPKFSQKSDPERAPRHIFESQGAGQSDLSDESDLSDGAGGLGGSRGTDDPILEDTLSTLTTRPCFPMADTANCAATRMKSGATKITAASIRRHEDYAGWISALK